MVAAVETKLRDVEIYPGIRIQIPDAPWNKRDAAAWYWPEPMKPSEWAEKYRVLERGAIPGPWRNENAPYLRGIMDLACKKGVERIIFKKAAQLGVSEAMRTLMGYWAHMDPAPMGLALPNKEKGREIVENDIMPFFKGTFARCRELAQLLPSRLHDIKKGQIKLVNNFLMHLMWSGSPSSMASNPMKRCISDEVDKFAAWAGNDADPISLIDFRTRTFPDRVHALSSTPTTSSGPISQNFEAAHIKLYFLVECPHCQMRQRLLFGEGADYGVKWSDDVRKLAKEGRREEAAAKVLQDPNACWYECCQCHAKINEQTKRQMVRGGKWATVGKDGMTADGQITDAEAINEFPRGTWLGMHISSLYCCWENWTMAHVAAEFLRAKTPAAKFAFRTSTLGEHYEESAQTVDVQVVNTRVTQARLPEGVIPRWCDQLIATVDTQKDHFWLVIRAWGPGMRSQRVWNGKVFSFDELDHWTAKHSWKNEDDRLRARICDCRFIDSGGTKKQQDETSDPNSPSRVMEVYAWVLANMHNTFAIKGDSHPEPGRLFRRGNGTYAAGGKEQNVPLWLVHAHALNDDLASMMAKNDKDIDYKTGELLADVPLWQLNSKDDHEYNHHLSNMHKVMEGSHGNTSFRWRPIRDGVRVDYRACEYYQVGAAYIRGVHLLPDMVQYMRNLDELLEAQKRQREQEPRRFETPYGQAFVASNR